jgi:GR25 family glycosyltransferase involved in LPS biosynthesis
MESKHNDINVRTNQFNLQDMCECYTVAYNSPERAAKMTERFSNIGLNLNIHKGVQMDDPRLSFAREDDIPAKRLASVFYGHLDNISKFYETGKPYGLFCEDDVHIHKDLGKELPIIMGEFNAMQLDILLLGYMTTKTIEWWQHGYPLVYDGKTAPYRYHRYPQDQWGIHLFMISRSYAKTLLDVYGPDYAARAYKNPNMICCNPDWTLSKYTQNRALRYPMMAVEDGKGFYDHHGQGEFHRESHRKNYREGEFW